jgi:hypothetical protein
VGFDRVALVAVDRPGLQVVLGHPERFLPSGNPAAGPRSPGVLGGEAVLRWRGSRREGRR